MPVGLEIRSPSSAIRAEVGRYSEAIRTFRVLLSATKNLLCELSEAPPLPAPQARLRASMLRLWSESHRAVREYDASTRKKYRVPEGQKLPGYALPAAPSSRCDQDDVVDAGGNVCKER